MLFKAILTGSLKFAIVNPFILPAITKLFKRLEILRVSTKETWKNFVSLYSTKMAVCCLELFVMINSLNIVRGILMEADEAVGTLSLKFVEMLLLFNSDSRDFSTIPENDRPVKFCGRTVCKLMA